MSKQHFNTLQSLQDEPEKYKMIAIMLCGSSMQTYGKETLEV